LRAYRIKQCSCGLTLEYETSDIYEEKGGLMINGEWLAPTVGDSVKYIVCPVCTEKSIIEQFYCDP